MCMLTYVHVPCHGLKQLVANKRSKSNFNIHVTDSVQ